jgi:hypothetical protein
MLNYEDFKQSVLEEALGGLDSGETIINEALQDHVKDKFDTVSWKVNKVDDGFKWEVYGAKYQKPSETLEDGTESTRAKATGKAKKVVMKYRKSDKEVAAERDAG